VPKRDVVTHLYEVSALWSASQGAAVDVVSAACEALVDGVDTPSLRMLAGVSARGLKGADHEIADLLRATLDELSVDYYEPGSLGADEAVVRIFARRAVRGEVAPHDLACWAHRVFGHRLPLAEPLAVLDDVYDTIEYTDQTPEQVDADILAAARLIAAGGDTPDGWSA
jgi:hypothetical protein